MTHATPGNPATDLTGALIPRHVRRAIGLSLVIACWAAAAQAADQPPPQPASQPAEEIQEIVVTGTAGGAEMRKQDAAYTITTIKADEIENLAPKSSAELLSHIPGVWVESSGGVSGANINVIGFPEAGDAPHVTFEINGAPLYGTESVSFMEQSSLFRVDETIGTVEGVIGGPGSVFGKGEPGLTVNHRLKEGGEQTEGSLKYTTSDYKLQRLDAVLSGKLTDNLYYMVGGYVQSSPGIRDAQFLSEKGHQFTINLTRKFENGRVNLWSRVTDDHGQWLLPMFSRSGNNLGTFSQLGDFTRVAAIRTGVDSGGNATYQTFDFANGRGWDGSVSGLSGEFNVSDNSVLRDNFALTRGNADTYGFVPDGGAVQVSTLTGTPGNPAAVFTVHAPLTPLPSSTWLQEYGWWVVQKKIRSLSNDLSLEVKTGANDLTVGYYVAQWSADEWWSLNNQAPVENVANGDLLGNVTCADLAAAGSGAGCWHYGISASGDSTARALYAGDTFHLTDQFRLEGGLRDERQTLDYYQEGNNPGQSFPANPAVPGSPAPLVVPHSSGSKVSYTAGADYEFTSTSGVYGRYTQGYHFPMFDDFRGCGCGSQPL
jgi:outer membrane receptor protein involved in Fe transport